MIERAGGARLLLEAPQRGRGRAANARRQHLDGDVAAEPRVARAIDLAHPAGAEQADDLVTAPARAGRELGRAAVRVSSVGTDSAASGPLGFMALDVFIIAPPPGPQD